jgi:hypothetical protein
MTVVAKFLDYCCRKKLEEWSINPLAWHLESFLTLHNKPSAALQMQLQLQPVSEMSEKVAFMGHGPLNAWDTCPVFGTR